MRPTRSSGVNVSRSRCARSPGWALDASIPSRPAFRLPSGRWIFLAFVLLDVVAVRAKNLIAGLRKREVRLQPCSYPPHALTEPLVGLAIRMDVIDLKRTPVLVITALGATAVAEQGKDFLPHLIAVVLLTY